MKKFGILILLTLFMSGCVVKKEGIGFGSFTNHYKSIEFEKCQLKGCPEEVVIVGNLSAYREIDENISEEYSKYSDAALKFVVDKPLNLTEREFRNSIIGWTMVQFFKIPLFGAYYSGALIDNTEHVKMQFPDSAEVILVGATGDLVAAKSNSDGVFFIERHLCSRGDKYKECKENFLRGIFDAKSGRELDLKYSEKKNGESINIETYEVLKNY